MMEHNCAAHAFATLGHPGRLAVLRLLMRFAPRGVRPTEIAEALTLKQNTLSHHLADLTGSGLVQVERRGRSLFYSADLDTTEGLIGYLALDVGRARPNLLGALLAPLLTARKDTSAMRDTDFDVLFICSGNSARSIF
ncbi:MAG: metalloregulator ArsR/SmtB family transcription factor, partial [Pseudomonadota bacterium]